MTRVHPYQCGRTMSQKPIEKILRNVGLTEKEAEIYIFLAKHNAMKGAEIAKLTNTDKAEVYRILRSLQNKALLEATLESPVRFTIVPFDKVLDSFIKARRDEVSLIENTRDDLLKDWGKISKNTLDTPIEKFVIIEGENKIQAKIFQQVKETKKHLSAIFNIADLLNGDKFGIFTALTEQLKPNVQVRLLTDLPPKNIYSVKILVKRILEIQQKSDWNVPELGLEIQPSMLITDQQELILFITPKGEVLRENDNEVCLWTNCRTIVQSFNHVFENLWDNSKKIEAKLAEVESGKPTQRTCVVKEATAALKAYEQATAEAQEGIVMITSSKGLADFAKTKLVEDWSKKGIDVRIMAPISSENLKPALELSETFKVRHVPASFLTTTVVDSNHLFQFNSLPQVTDALELQPFENMLYSNDAAYVEKTKAMLEDVWRNARAPSAVTLESVITPATQDACPPKGKRFSEYKKGLNITKMEFDKLKEEDIINKIINAKKEIPRGAFNKHVDVFYGSSAVAIIHPPDFFNLPPMIIQVARFEKPSSLGGHEEITISSWLDTGNGFAYVPVANVCDNPRVVAHRKRLYAGKPIAQNVQLVRKEELQVRVHGKSMFAAWTVPIRLYPPPSTLPPCCILFEGYGELRPRVMETEQAERRQIFESNTFEAFVTFFHPSSKYSGPGTEGLLSRDLVLTTYPLNSREQ